MEIIAKRYHFANAIRRLAKAAEHDFLKTGNIAKPVRRGNNLFRRGVAVFQPQIVAVIARPLVTNTEITTVRTLVRKVDIKVSIERIHVRIFAVLVLRACIVLCVLPFILLLLFLIILIIIQEFLMITVL